MVLSKLGWSLAVTADSQVSAAPRSGGTGATKDCQVAWPHYIYIYVCVCVFNFVDLFIHCVGHSKIFVYIKYGKNCSSLC